nr:hypothetical protein [Candidatus Freyarchaeota archaeon]
MSIDVKRANSLIKELYREYLLEEGGTWKTPSNQEIVDLLTRNGYTRKEAEKLIREHTEQLLQPYFKIYPIIYHETWEPMDERTLNELEHLPTRMYESMDECDLADYYIDTLSLQIDRMVKENLRKYILEAPHDPTDKTEKLIRTIYAEREKHFLARHTLLLELIRRGFTREEAEETVQKYEKRYVLLRYESYVRTKQYKQTQPEASPQPIRQAFHEAASQGLTDEDGWLDEDTLTYLLTLQNIPEPQARKTIQTAGLEARNAFEERDGYEITRIEDLLITWAHEVKEAQEEQPPDKFGNPNATKNVGYRDIWEIFRQAAQQGRKTLTHAEIVQEIRERCGVDSEEAEEAFWAALKTFKLRPEIEKNRNKKWEEKEYWWGGSCEYHPPKPLETLYEEEA